MSLRFVDGFDHYSPASDITLKYSSTANNGTNFSSIAQATGRFSGFCLKTRSFMIFLNLGASQATWTIGYAFKYDNVSQLPVALTQFCNGFTPQVNVYLDATGKLNLGQGSTGSLTQISTGSPKIGSTVLSAGVWYYIEIQTTLTSTNLTSFKVYIDGVSEINWSGTKAISPLDTIALGDYNNNTNNSSNASYFDDLYICDGSGSVNNTVLGDQRVETIYPSGAGNSTQWTFVGGSANFSNVNTAGSQDGDTAYVKSATAGQIDSYAMGNLATTPTTVAGVVVSSIARKDDAGARTFCGLVRTSSINYVTGQANNLNSSYRTFQDIFELNPNTGVAWTGSQINAMEAGVKLLS